MEQRYLANFEPEWFALINRYTSHVRFESTDVPFVWSDTSIGVAFIANGERIECTVPRTEEHFEDIVCLIELIGSKLRALVM